MAWASITNNHRISEKSVPLKQFLDICAGIKADFVSFQRELEVADPDCLLRKFGVRTIRREVLNAESQSFLEELIDEMRQLKCLVTVSTTTTHIAASLGIRVELVAAERKGHQWFWQVQANHNKTFYPSVNVHIGNGESGQWWEKSLGSANDSVSRYLNGADAGHDQ